MSFASVPLMSESKVMTGQMSQAGRVEVVLERPCAVVRDELTGETVAENAERFTLSADKPRVWFLGVR